MALKIHKMQVLIIGFFCLLSLSSAQGSYCKPLSMDEHANIVSVSCLVSGHQYVFDWSAGDTLIPPTSGSTSKILSVPVFLRQKMRQGLLSDQGSVIARPFYCPILENVFSNMVWTALRIGVSITGLHPKDRHRVEQYYERENACKNMTRVWKVVPREKPLAQGEIFVTQGLGDLALCGMPAPKIYGHQNFSVHSSSLLAQDKPLEDVCRLRTDAPKFLVTIDTFFHSKKTQLVWDASNAMMPDFEADTLMTAQEFLCAQINEDPFGDGFLCGKFLTLLAFDITQDRNVTFSQGCARECDVESFAQHRKITWFLEQNDVNFWRISDAHTMSIKWPGSQQGIRGIAQVPKRSLSQKCPEMCGDEDYYGTLAQGLSGDKSASLRKGKGQTTRSQKSEDRSW